MVVVVKIPSLLHQNISHYDVDLPIVSFDYLSNLGYALRVVELVIDSQCDLPLHEPYNFLLNMM